MLKAFGTNDWVSSIRKTKLPLRHFELMQLLKEELRQDRGAEMESRRKTITQGKVFRLTVMAVISLVRRC